VSPSPLAFATATAAFQVEGSLEADGRGRSIWDTFCAEPGRIEDGTDGNVVCDSYRRWPEDLDLVAGLGVDAYRFSISWPRVQPDGRGIEPRGLDAYERVVDGLAERDLDAHVTLYHWDLPQALQDAGGWPARDTALRFAEYAGIVAERLGDRVARWATLNEPWVSAFEGYAAGLHAPGHADPDEAFRAAHHLLLAHALGADAVRGALPSAERENVGIVLNLTTVITEDDSVTDVAARVDAQHNGLWLSALRDGRYPDLAIETGPVLGDASVVRAMDLGQMQGSADWLGVNYYSPIRVAPPGSGAGGPGQEPETFPGVGAFSPAPRPPLTTMGWEVDPSGLAALLDRLHAWDPSMPLHITENGMACPDDVRRPDGSVDDQDRIDYLRRHLAEVDAARDRGIDLRTYTVWSLLDNFEWAKGLSKTFGVVEVDRDTQDRRPKASCDWLRSEIARRRAQ
jgi:beta-glucosidase